MAALSRWNYYRRVISAYLTPATSQLTFWHDTPEVNEPCDSETLGQYYMPFREKADYPGPYDKAGIPLLNYHGAIGLQYNPIAIAQYGLGNYNLYKATGDERRVRRVLAVADWLVTNLEQNRSGVWVWNHHFDWDYRSPLTAPWYSALAQGQGISLLVRTHKETGNGAYLASAERALQGFFKTVDQGGVTYIDESGRLWFEEYIVSPPTHILNGFIWAAWGVYDYFLATGDQSVRALFDEAVRTLAANLHRYDAGFWSLYEQSGTRLRMFASPFYHRLHIVQLHILHRLTGEDIFRRYAMRWEGFGKSKVKRLAALAYKIAFKALYY